MKYRFLFICSMLVSFTLNFYAQSTLTLKGDMMYTNVTLSHNGISRNVSALIDTGSSVCVIDSTYAADSCRVVATQSNASIGNTSGKRIKSFDFNIDSISVAGVSYPMTRCFVVDLAGKLQHLAPKFILGGDLLKKEIWCFDLNAHIIKRSNAPQKESSICIKWKNHDDYRDASLNSIYFNGTIGGKKTRIFFDTGSKRNKLPKTFGIAATREIEGVEGNIANKVRMIKGGLCERISMELSKNKFLLDFTLNNDKYPRVNASFLLGKSFVLDYSHKTLYILK
ncbi:retropepsin-like domain-containing protein [Prevotella buccae]|nr:retropepsin-like domain-containing protein [Segatella buccae]